MEEWSRDDDAVDGDLAPANDELRADIRRFRLEEDLPADDLTVEEFVREYRAGRQPPGLWVTDAEHGAASERRDRIDAGRERVDAYAESNPQTFAGDWCPWRRGLQTHVVAFTRDLERHRRALTERHPHPDVLEVVHRPQTQRELVALKARARIVLRELDELGVLRWLELGRDVESNCVAIAVIAADEVRARELLTERLGDGIVIEFVDEDQLDVSWP